MANYRKLYYLLFNKLTDIIAELQTVQQEAEELYINGDEAPIELYRAEDKKEDSISAIPPK